MTRYIALFRGLNVGGGHKVPMAALRRFMAGLGFADVATYIQSGNAVFDADADAASATSTIETAFAHRFGFAVPLVLLTVGQLDEAIDGNPFASLTDDHRMLHTGFFKADPDPDRLAALAPLEKDGERHAVAGRVIYLYLPHYSARSELAGKVAGGDLGAPVTLRNWRSVRALAEMAHPAD